MLCYIARCAKALKKENQELKDEIAMLQAIIAKYVSARDYCTDHLTIYIAVSHGR